MKYAKRSRTGTYKTVSDITDATDVILGIREFEAQQMKIIKQENNSYSQSSSADVDIQTALDEQRDAIIKDFVQAEKDTNDKHQSEVQALQDKIEELQDQNISLAQRIYTVEDLYQEQKALNSNLIRIARERANADRGIPGKKNHPGYLVLSSAEYRERVYDKNMHDALTNAWRTSLQTPYDASIEYDAVRAQIQADLMDGVFSLLGIVVIPRRDMEDVVIDWYETDNAGRGHAVCGVFKMLFTADFRGGYWTVDLHTNLPPTVSVELRPEKRSINKGGVTKK